MTEKIVLVAGVVASCAGGAWALPVAEFGFEDVDLGTSPVFSMSDNGLNVRVTGGPAAAVTSASGTTPASWGSRHLGLFGVPGGSLQSVTFSFIGGVTGFSIEYGDFLDDIDTVTFRMYSAGNGTGTLIGTESRTYDASLPDSNEYLFSFLAPTTALGSVVIESSSGFSGLPSMYFDNLTVFIPSPGAAGVLAGAAMLTIRRRR